MKVYQVDGRELDLRGSILVMPAVAFANIGELAMDVLVTTLQLQLAARLQSPHVLPCVGNDAYGPPTAPAGTLATALEVYHLPGSRLYALQQRAPAIPGLQAQYALEVATWLRSSGVGSVLLLAGLDAQFRRERQLEGSQLRFMALAAPPAAALATAGDPAAPDGGVSSGAASAMQMAGVAAGAGVGGSSSQGQGEELDVVCVSQGLRELEPEVVEVERELHGLLPPWPLLDALGGLGGGRCGDSAASTSGSSAAAQGAPVSVGEAQQQLGALQLEGGGPPPRGVLLTVFAAEGDNVPHALSLAHAALQLLLATGAASLPSRGTVAGLPAAAGLAPGADEVGRNVAQQLRVPCSWVGLYGRSFDRSLF